MLPYFKKVVFFFSILIVEFINPCLSKSIFFKIFPLELVKTDIPEFADLSNGTPLSIDLNIDAAKCCLGPIVFPNHASFVMLMIKSKLSRIGD